ncbi:MAG: IS200/IS605 family element transposase accessory protein TnpB [Thaumarchaeota archaeon]|nr:MAG: IS200/IS605 family element transposase accessory protein TnpB [Nitrososphaerota archaeon]
MTQVIRGYKTALRATKAQEELFTKASGIARFAYNWGLERNNNVYLWNQLPLHPPLKYESPVDQHRILNARKAKDYPWMYEVSKCAPQEALRDLGSAFHNFLIRRDRFRWPSFKSKRHGAKQSFTLTGAVRVKDRMIRLPTFGWVKLKERGYLPARSHVLCATVSRRAGRWFVSIGVRKKRVRPRENDGPVAGVDWGIIHPATVSDGTTLERPRLERLKWQERHAQKALTRKAKGSKNRLKALLRHQKIWYRITNIRVDRLHKFTTTLARTKSVVVVEDLAASKMAKNHSLAGAIYGGAPYEMRRQLEYKTKWHGTRLIVAPRNYPSTKMCSGCGIKNGVSLGERTYHCAGCGLVIDRDLNAAINLANYYHCYGTASSAGRACQMQEVTSPQGLVPAGEAGRVGGAV